MRGRKEKLALEMDGRDSGPTGVVPSLSLWMNPSSGKVPSDQESSPRTIASKSDSQQPSSQLLAQIADEKESTFGNLHFQHRSSNRSDALVYLELSYPVVVVELILVLLDRPLASASWC